MDSKEAAPLSVACFNVLLTGYETSEAKNPTCRATKVSLDSLSLPRALTQARPLTFQEYIPSHPPFTSGNPIQSNSLHVGITERRAKLTTFKMKSTSNMAL